MNNRGQECTSRAFSDATGTGTEWLDPSGSVVVREHATRVVSQAEQDAAALASAAVLAGSQALATISSYILPPVANNFDPSVNGLAGPEGAMVTTIDGMKSWIHGTPATDKRHVASSGVWGCRHARPRQRWKLGHAWHRLHGRRHLHHCGPMHLQFQRGDLFVDHRLTSRPGPRGVAAP
jgi:hypothetical protein